MNRDARPSARLTVVQCAFGVLVSLAIWSLVFVYSAVMPSLTEVTVHKSDRSVLMDVRRTATYAAIVSTFAGALIGSCVTLVLCRRCCSFRKHGEEGPTA